MVVGFPGFLKRVGSFIRCFRLWTWQTFDVDSSIGLDVMVKYRDRGKIFYPVEVKYSCIVMRANLFLY